jgi:hypothetical protein
MSFETELRAMVQSEVAKMPQEKQDRTWAVFAFIGFVLAVLSLAYARISIDKRLSRLETIVATDREFAHGAAGLNAPPLTEAAAAPSLGRRQDLVPWHEPEPTIAVKFRKYKLSCPPQPLAPAPVPQKSACGCCSYCCSCCPCGCQNAAALRPRVRLLPRREPANHDPEDFPPNPTAEQIAKPPLEIPDGGGVRLIDDGKGGIKAEVFGPRKPSRLCAPEPVFEAGSNVPFPEVLCE